MSPELHIGIKSDFTKVNVWALGVFLFIIYTGLNPFDSTKLKDCYRFYTWYHGK